MSNINPNIRWKKSVVSKVVGNTLYQSIPFTWLLPKAEELAKKHDGPVVAGGPAVNLMGAPWAKTPKRVPKELGSVLQLHNTLATFTTRGCPNRCRFCAVPKIEGRFVELRNYVPAPIVCDNNLGAATRGHFKRVIDSLRDFQWTDFNQGLDASLFTDWHADQIARLRRPMVRFAFDSLSEESDVADALAIARKAGLKHFGVYVLIGFRDTPETAKYRLEKVREWGIRPNPMRFQPLDTLKKNSYVAAGWTDRLLRDMVRYYSCLRWLGNIPFEQYDRSITNRKTK